MLNFSVCSTFSAATTYDRLEAEQYLRPITQALTEKLKKMAEFGLGMKQSPDKETPEKESQTLTQKDILDIFINNISVMNDIGLIPDQEKHISNKTWLVILRLPQYFFESCRKQYKKL